MRKRIYLLMETKKRELDSRCYFAIKSCLKNYSVVLLKKDSFYRNKRHFRPGVVYLKSLGTNYFKELQKIKKLGFKVAVQDEEGLMYFDKNDYLARRIYPENLRYVDYIFAWGNDDFQVLSQSFNDIKNKIHATGNSRIDILKNPINKIYHDEAKKINKIYGNFFLYNTMFTFYNHFYKSKKTKYNDLNNQSEESKNYQSEEVNKKKIYVNNKNIQMEEFQKKTMEKTIEFIEKFALRFPSEKLIIRPHPSENHKIWMNIGKKFKNVITVCDDISTCAWTLASNFSISSNCTTSVESFLLKKLNYNFRPVIDENVEFKLPKICGINIETADDLIKRVDNYLIGKSDEKTFNSDYELKSKQLENKMFNIHPNICSVESMIDRFNKDLDDKINNTVKKDANANYFLFFIYYFMLKAKFIKMKISAIFNKEIKEKIDFAVQKFPGLNEKELRQKISILCDKMNLKEKIEVKEIYPGCFLIENMKF